MEEFHHLALLCSSDVFRLQLSLTAEKFDHKQSDLPRFRSSVARDWLCNDAVRNRQGNIPFQSTSASMNSCLPLFLPVCLH